MRNAFVLAKRDLNFYLNSWTGVLIISFFLFVAGVFFSLLILSFAKISVDAASNAYQGVAGLSLTRFVLGSFFLNLATVLIFLIPFMTMRSFAEERSAQTLELLYTYPFSDFEIVWGKFLSIVWFFELLFLPTVSYVLVLHYFGGKLDWGPIAMGYLGFWLLGVAYLSLGLFVSSVSENQVVSAVITFSLLIVFWVLDWVAGVTDGKWAQFFSALSPLGHYREFTLGVLDLGNIVYFVFFHFYFLFLTLRSVESRNWKG